MEIDGQILERTAALIYKGQALFTFHPSDAIQARPLPIRLDQYMMWRAQCLTFMIALLGDSHTYTQEFSASVPAASVAVSPGWVSVGLGVLHALNEDLANGYLGDFRVLVSAEVFTELLGQAEHLLEHGYKDPTASLSGAVLEDGLRRIAGLKSVKVKGNDGLSALNQSCAQAGVYNALMQKRIQVWIEIRNKADHGHFSEYTDSDVREMVSGVRGFLSDYLR
jgi:hypothetical protein